MPFDYVQHELDGIDYDTLVKRCSDKDDKGTNSDIFYDLDEDKDQEEWEQFLELVSEIETMYRVSRLPYVPNHHLKYDDLFEEHRWKHHDVITMKYMFDEDQVENIRVEKLYHEIDREDDIQIFRTILEWVAENHPKQFSKILKIKDWKKREDAYVGIIKDYFDKVQGWEDTGAQERETIYIVGTNCAINEYVVKNKAIPEINNLILGYMFDEDLDYIKNNEEEWLNSALDGLDLDEKVADRIKEDRENMNKIEEENLRSREAQERKERIQRRKECMERKEEQCIKLKIFDIKKRLFYDEDTLFVFNTEKKVVGKIIGSERKMYRPLLTNEEKEECKMLRYEYI